MKLILVGVALVAGMLGPLQAALNGKMGRALQDPFYAALISFGVGTLGLLVWALMFRVDFGAIRQGAQVHWSVWSAGLLGAFYVTAVIILTPRLGATLTFALVVAGQLGMSLFLDHFSLLGLPLHPFSWQRLAGIALITAGVILIRKF